MRTRQNFVHPCCCASSTAWHVCGTTVVLFSGRSIVLVVGLLTCVFSGLITSLRTCLPCSMVEEIEGSIGDERFKESLFFLTRVQNTSTFESEEERGKK